MSVKGKDYVVRSNTQTEVTPQSQKSFFKISQLVRETGVSKSTIHYYINCGLLPKPLKVGLNVHLYDQGHLNRVHEIKRLRKEERLSLEKIKIRLKNWVPDSTYSPSSQDKHLVNESTVVEIQENTLKRNQLIDTAARLFSQKGYESVRISDITQALQMGKSTFYVYYQSKEEIFLACIEKLSLLVVPQEEWNDIIGEKDFFKKQVKRAIAFLKAFPNYSGMLNLAKQYSSGPKKELAGQAQTAILVMTRALERDIRRAQREGYIRNIDPDIISHGLLGFVESLGYRLSMDSKYSLDDVGEIYEDFLINFLAIS